ncbi:MAG: YHS domain-containing protein [Deltaproteobacteria bacterium]|nr:YHS domain-containing protein [Deltaproteobacteria bacterium]
MSEDPKNPTPTPPSAPNALACPTCGKVVDPKKTTQAVPRKGRLLLFCSSGCLRQFLAAEKA